MPSLKISKVLPYKAQELFDIIIDIESYSEFIPWCSKSKIMQKNEDFILAELEAKFGLLQSSYVSRVTCGGENEKYVRVEAVRGPFKNLLNLWQLTPIEDGSKTLVDLTLDVEFESKTLSNIAGVFFNKGADKVVKAFEDRAFKLLGKGNS